MSSSRYGGRGLEVIAVAWAFFVVATVIVALRFYTGWFITRRLRWDFYWVILTYVSSLYASNLGENVAQEEETDFCHLERLFLHNFCILGCGQS